MWRRRRWIIALLVAYNALAAGANAFLIAFWPDYQADEQTRTDILVYALINLGLLAALIYSYWQRPTTIT
jgi:hypothetical protein